MRKIAKLPSDSELRISEIPNKPKFIILLNNKFREAFTMGIKQYAEMSSLKVINVSY